MYEWRFGQITCFNSLQTYMKGKCTSIDVCNTFLKKKTRNKQTKQNKTKKQIDFKKSNCLNVFNQNVGLARKGLKLNQCKHAHK